MGHMIMALLFCALYIPGLLCTFQTIAPGVWYMHINTQSPSVQSIHILSVNPQKARIELGLAHDKCASSETTSAMARRTNAIAAINGGFFDFGIQGRLNNFLTVALDRLGIFTYNAYPIYGLKIDTNWLALSHMHTGICGWRDGGKVVLFDTIATEPYLIINNMRLPIEELNKPHMHNNTMLYTPQYDKKTPQAKKITEIVINNNIVVKTIHNSKGQTPIPQTGYVYAMKSALTTIQEHDSAHVHMTTTRLNGIDTTHVWESADYALASTPLLIEEGAILPRILEYTGEFYTNNHPRTAVGIRKNGTWVLVVVDGRQKHAHGMSIAQLADLMLQLGCHYALNLDGGGSSTMVINDRVVNSISGRSYSLIKKERPISTALLIMATP